MAKTYRAEAVIDAPPEKVWAVLVNLPRYPEWNPFTVAVESTLEVGDPVDLTVRLGRYTRPQREFIRRVVPGERVCWGMKLAHPALVSGERCQWLEPVTGGKTRYVTQDVITGALSPLVHLLFGARVGGGFEAMTRALKERVETLEAG